MATTAPNDDQHNLNPAPAHDAAEGGDLALKKIEDNAIEARPIAERNEKTMDADARPWPPHCMAADRQGVP